jgi:predicted RNA binding protein YcfA (HicA-like mRNA interferase family)
VLQAAGSILEATCGSHIWYGKHPNFRKKKTISSIAGIDRPQPK